MPPDLRNHLEPTGGDTPASRAASSLERPVAIAAQNRTSSSRRAESGRPGECNLLRPDRSDRRLRTVIATSYARVLRRPIELALITFINIVGGIIIGVAQQDMTLAGAAENYTVLTVGNGLVSQIPALIVSTAAGLLVTKTGLTESAGKLIFGQLGTYSSALGLSTFLLVALAVLPGIPAVPFLLLALLTGGATWAVTRRDAAEIEE